MESRSFDLRMSLARRAICKWDTDTLCNFLEKHKFMDAYHVAVRTNKNGFDFLNAVEDINSWQLSKKRSKAFLDFVERVNENAIYFSQDAEESVASSSSSHENNGSKSLSGKLKEKLNDFYKQKRNTVDCEAPEIIYENFHEKGEEYINPENDNHTDYDIPNDDSFESNDDSMEDIETSLYTQVQTIKRRGNKSTFSSKQTPLNARLRDVSRNSVEELASVFENSLSFKPSGVSNIKPGPSRNSVRKENPTKFARNEKTSSWKLPPTQQIILPSKNHESPTMRKPTTTTMRNRPVKKLESVRQEKRPTSKRTPSPEINDEDDGYLTPIDVLQERRESGSMMRKSKGSFHKPPNNSGETLIRPLPALPKTYFEEETDSKMILNVSRARSESMLFGKEDGTFLFRPTKQPNCLCTLVVMYKKWAYHICVRENEDGSLGLGNEQKDNEPIFRNLMEIIQYYQKNQVKLISKGHACGQVNLTYCDYVEIEDIY